MNHDQNNTQSRFVRRVATAIIASAAGLVPLASASDIEQATVPDFDALRADASYSLERFAHAAAGANIIASLADRGIVDDSGCYPSGFGGADWQSPANLDLATLLVEEVSARIGFQSYLALETVEAIESFLDCLDWGKVAVSYKPFQSFDAGTMVEQIRDAFVAGDAVNLTVYLPDYIDLGEQWGVVAHGGTHFEVTLRGVSAKSVLPAVLSIADPVYDDDNDHDEQSAFRFPSSRVGEEELAWVIDPNNPWDVDEGVRTSGVVRLYDATVPAFVVGMTRASELNVFTPNGAGTAIDVTPGGGRDSRNKISIPAPDGELVKDLAVAPNGRDLYVITQDSTGATSGWFVEHDPEPPVDQEHKDWIDLLSVNAGGSGDTTVEWLALKPTASGAAALLEVNGQTALYTGGVRVALGDITGFAPRATLPSGFSMLEVDPEHGEVLSMNPTTGEVLSFDDGMGEPAAALLLPAVQAARAAAVGPGNIVLKRGIMTQTNNTDGTGTITYTGLEAPAGGAHEVLFAATGAQFVGTDIGFLDDDTFCVANNGFLRCFDLVEVTDPASGTAEIDFVEVGGGPIECGPFFDLTPNIKVGPGVGPLVPQPGALPELPGFIEECDADVTTTGATLEGQPGFGIPDGNVDLDDLGYFLNLWVAADTKADLTTTGATLEGQPGFGIPDGNVDLDDLGFFLNAWTEGCP